MLTVLRTLFLVLLFPVEISQQPGMSGEGFQLLFFMLSLAHVFGDQNYTTTAQNPSYVNSNLDLSCLTSIIFQVIAKDSMVVSLTKTLNVYSTDIYEFYIYTLYSYTSVYITKNGAVSSTKAITNPLSNSAYTWLWITWDSGVLKFGLGNVSNTNMYTSWTDSSPIPVRYFGMAVSHAQTTTTVCYYTIPDVMYQPGTCKPTIANPSQPITVPNILVTTTSTETSTRQVDILSTSSSLQTKDMSTNPASTELSVQLSEAPTTSLSNDVSVNAAVASTGTLSVVIDLSSRSYQTSTAMFSSEISVETQTISSISVAVSIDSTVQLPRASASLKLVSTERPTTDTQTTTPGGSARSSSTTTVHLNSIYTKMKNMTRQFLVDITPPRKIYSHQDYQPVFMPCPPPPQIRNAHLTVSNGRSSYAVYSCYLGHQFQNLGVARSIVCVNGTWINSDLDGCQPVSCDTQVSTDNHVTGSLLTYIFGQTAEWKCSSNDGIFDFGLKFTFMKCTLKSGNSDDALQVRNCSDDACHPPPFVENAVTTYQLQLRTISLACLPGYRFSSGETIKTVQCHNDGTWTVEEKCQTCYCPTLIHPANGFLDSDDVFYGAVVVSRCFVGFMFPNNSSMIALECIDNGNISTSLAWNGSLPNCTAVYCTAPPTASNVFVSGLVNSSNDWYIYGSTITYRCLTGLRFKDGYMDKNITCGGTGQWNETEFGCEVNRCDPVPVIDHAQPNSTSALKGHTVTYTCTPGYHFEGSSRISSTCDGISWSSISSTSCQPIVCPPVNITNGFLNFTSNVFNANATVFCNEGYLMDGRSTESVSCSAGGEWSLNTSRMCQPVDCGPPPTFSIAYSMSMNDVSTTYGSQLTYVCPPGYAFTRGVFSQKMSCGSNGNWTRFQQTDCSMLTCLAPVFYIVNTSSTSIGTSINASCPPGYTMHNKKTSAVSLCNIVGDWESTLPACEQYASTQSRIYPKVEGPGSVGIGTVCIGLIFSLIILVLSLDISTFRNSIRACRNN